MHPHERLPDGFYRLISAQFFSALADNALLLLGIFVLQQSGYPGWWAPLLKFCLNATYVLLASVTGPLADSMPKAQLMAWMNGLKILGVVLLFTGAHPALCFSVTGLAAAAYAPAKYGLLTESVAPACLVRANAWLEVSIVMSVILGTALGGSLVALSQQPWLIQATQAHLTTLTSRANVAPALLLMVGIYLLAAVFNAGLKTGRWSPEHHPLRWNSLSFKSFWRDNLRLWRDPLGGLSLYVTTLYWGAGAVIQFAVLVWAIEGLGLKLQHGAYLQALVAIGVITGAFLAGRLFKLHGARKALPMGLILPALLPLIALCNSLWLALPMMLMVGVAGGMLLVPMNALLQHRGRQLLRSGQSIAVQGFNENLSVLVMLGLYSGLLSLELPIWSIMVLLSALLTAGMVPVLWRKRTRRGRPG